MSTDVSPAAPAPRRVRRTFPLYARVMLWFLGNLLLVAVGAFWLLRSQFGLDNSWLLTRESRVRWQLLAETVRVELDDTAPAEWTALLQRFGESERMRFFLADAAGRVVAGPAEQPWPPEVRERLALVPENSLCLPRSGGASGRSLPAENPAMFKDEKTPSPTLSSSCHLLPPPRFAPATLRGPPQLFSSPPFPNSLPQLAAALRSGDVSFRDASTPQAKGKIECCHQLWQRRLPALFSTESVTDLHQANLLLDHHQLAHFVLF